ncbi:MAG: hypothetical protein AAF830_06795 [Pseudomonadota bacterium]
MKLEGALTSEDRANALAVSKKQIWTAADRRLQARSWLIVVFIPPLLIGLYRWDVSPAIEVFFACLAGLVLMRTLQSYVLKRVQSRVGEVSESMNAITTVELTDDKIIFRSDSSSTELYWGVIRTVTNLNGTLIIGSDDPSLQFVIPSAAFSGDDQRGAVEKVIRERMKVRT